jgi:tetraacyldisaccharide 4'-kinase
LHVPPHPRSPMLAFSGIARPHRFRQMLQSCGLRVIDCFEYPDHHRYTAGDMRSLVQRLGSSAAQAFITTEKDAVKITPELRATLESAAPMLVAQLRVEFTDPASLLAELEARCR